PALFKMPYGATSDERLGNLRHGNGTLYPGGDAKFFQRVLQRQRIDYRGQHAHVIASGAFDTAFAPGKTAKDIPAADYDNNLHAQFAHFADLPRHALHRFGRDAHTRRAAERFTAQFEQNPAVLGIFTFHASETPRRVLTVRGRKVK